MKFLRNKIRTFIISIISSEIKSLPRFDPTPDYSSALNQKQLMMLMQKTNFNITDLGFSVFSESDEDGLLLYIFSKIGFKTKICIDIGGGKGLIGSNTANLFLNHGFTGLIIEREPNNVIALKAEYNSKNATRHFAPTVISENVTVNNINILIESNEIRGEIDLLSIDIDSIDYWIWDAIKVVDPKVVIVEIQSIFSEGESKTVPSDFNQTVFETIDDKRYGIYNSASLKAFTKLASRKGYSLVATSQLGFNAIFIKDYLLTANLTAISVEQGLNKPFTKWAQKTFGDKIGNLEWIEV